MKKMFLVSRSNPDKSHTWPTGGNERLGRARCGVWTKLAILAFTFGLTGTNLILPAGSAGATAQNGTPITIGVLETRLAGPTQIDEEPVLAVWAKMVNAQGGLNGHPVQITLEQVPGDVASSVAGAQKLIAEGVDALVDADSNDAAWAQYAEQAGVPVFLSSDTLAFGSSDDAFGIAQSPIVSTAEQMVAAKKAGATKLAIMYCTELSNCAQAVPFYKSVGKEYGVDLAYDVSVSNSSPNYLAQCLGAQSAGANVLFVASVPGTVLRVAADCNKQGYHPHLLAGAGSYQKSTPQSPGTNGLIATVPMVPFFDTSNPAIKSMTNELNKYNPSITKSPYYDDIATMNWSNAVILGAAVRKAKIPATTPVSRSGLRDALSSCSTRRTPGASSLQSPWPRVSQR